MKISLMVGITVAGVLMLTAGGVQATPPGPGQHFDCSDGGNTSCAADDPGCVSNTRDHEKCSRAIGRAFAKAVYGVIKCHITQVGKRFKSSANINGQAQAEENCEEGNGNGHSAKEKLDDVLAMLAASGRCDPAQLAAASAREADLFGTGPTSLDARNAQVYCDPGDPIGGDDSGSVPTTPDVLKCEVTVARNVGRLYAFATKCHEKMNHAFAKGEDFDEETCEETDPISHRGALDKYNQQRDKLAALNICPSCMDGAAIDSLGSATIAEVESANAGVFPCNLGP